MNVSVRLYPFTPMRLFQLIVMGTLFIVPPALSAQNHPAKRDIIEVEIVNSHNNDSTAGRKVYDIFIENAPKAFNVPGAPRFAIEGKDKKFYLGIGGQVKGTLSYDFGNPIDNGYDFTTSAIPMTRKAGDGGLVQFNAATSGLFVNFVALPDSKDKIGVYLNANLTGGTNYGFSLQYAYIKYRGITAGYNYSLFSDMAAAPPSIDNEGPCGFTAIPKGVLDYTFNLSPKWSMGVGLEATILSATTDKSTYTVTQRVPDIPLYIQYSWGGGSSWLRASAIMRNMIYRDCVANKNRDNIGWGVKLSGSASLSPFITAYYQGAYGKGITSYFQDLFEGGLDMVPDAARPGRLSKVKTWGGYIGLQYNLSRNVYATTTYSHVRNYAPAYSEGVTPWNEQYAYAQYALANVMWQINSVVSTGIEYIYGRRVNHSGAQAHDSRIQTMLMVSF